jgi:hypothetical protein
VVEENTPAKTLRMQLEENLPPARLEEILEAADTVGDIIDVATENDLMSEEIDRAIDMMPEESMQKQSAFDAFFDAFCEVMHDKLKAAIKMRGFVENALHQLWLITRSFTTMANVLQVEYDGHVVEPSDSWSYWNANRIRSLGTLIVAYVDQTVQENQRLSDNISALQKRYNEFEEKHNQVVEKQHALDVTVEARIADYQRQIKELIRLKEFYHDQSEYVVGRIDPLTKKPIHFFCGDINSVKSCAERKTALKFTEERSARDFRSAIVRGLRHKHGLKAYGIRNEIVVMQVSLCQIVLDEGDE